MIRILLLLLAVLWIAPAQAQTPTRLCFPTGSQAGTRTSCQDVTATNPLPVTGINISVGSLTLSAANAVTATLANSTAGIGLVTIANTATVPAIVSLVNTTVNIGNTAVVTCTNCGASSFTTQPSLVTIANTASLPAIVSMVNIPSASGPMAVTCTNCGAASFTTQPSLVTIANTATVPAIVSLVNTTVNIGNVPGQIVVTCTNCGASSFTTQPSLVTIANTATVPAIVSLVNTTVQIGNTVAISPLAGVTLTQTSTPVPWIVVKGAAGNLINLSGSLSSSNYIMVFNATSAPADGTVTPVKCWGPFAANGPFVFGWGPGPILSLSTGITIVSSSTGCFLKTQTPANFIAAEFQ